ncbi:MAG: hypothetical protein GF311_28200 [Candidatus Lokiarchaeota archaeon]|nr:hypothetical protein [Candidatus Lokiarchaeota archaeon]
MTDDWKMKSLRLCIKYLNKIFMEIPSQLEIAYKNGRVKSVGVLVPIQKKLRLRNVSGATEYPILDRSFPKVVGHFLFSFSDVIYSSWGILVLPDFTEVFYEAMPGEKIKYPLSDSKLKEELRKVL